MDISTSVIGVCCLKTSDGSLVSLNSLKLNTVEHDTLWSKADTFAEFIKTKFQSNTVRRVFVEAHAKMFTPGFSSADTLFTLAKFNGICSYIVHTHLGVPIHDINVTSARSKLGLKIDRKDKTKTTKEKVREQLLLLYPNIPISTHVAKTGKSKGQVVPDKEMEDMLDAYVIVAGGRQIHPC